MFGAVHGLPDAAVAYWSVTDGRPTGQPGQSGGKRAADVEGFEHVDGHEPGVRKWALLLAMVIVAS